MKNRIHFEPSDFQGRGQMLIRESVPSGSIDYKLAAAASYKVGYLRNSVFLMAVEDGQSVEFTCIEELCDALNQDEFGYRPMTREEIQQVAAFVGNRFPE